MDETDLTQEQARQLIIQFSVGDAAAGAIMLLQRAEGGLRHLSLEQAKLFAAALRALDQLYQSVKVDLV
jgi:hypothetical protein